MAVISRQCLAQCRRRTTTVPVSNIVPPPPRARFLLAAPGIAVCGSYSVLSEVSETCVLAKKNYFQSGQSHPCSLSISYLKSSALCFCWRAHRNKSLNTHEIKQWNRFNQERAGVGLTTLQISESLSE